MKKDYILLLMKESPDLSVEEAECKAREKWKSMSNEEKLDYKLRQGLQPQSKDTIVIYECAWGSCEYQFEDISDLIVHVMEGVHLSKKGCRSLYILFSMYICMIVYFTCKKDSTLKVLTLFMEGRRVGMGK